MTKTVKEMIAEYMEETSISNHEHCRAIIRLLQADVKRLRKALHNIKIHQDTVCNGNVKLSTTWHIANKALIETDPERKVEL